MTDSLQTLDVLGTAAAACLRDGRVAIATIIDTWGSAPVPVGGQMVIDTNGAFQGSVSGGCVEGDVIAEAMELLETGGGRRVLSFGVEDEAAWRVGLPCGGKIRILVELHAGEDGLRHLDRLVAARQAREALVVTTPLGAGAARVRTRSDATTPSHIAAVFQSAKSGVEETADGEVFVHALVPPPRVLVIGATHIGQVLCELVRIVGFEAIVVDPRPAFAAEARFGATRIVNEWPQDALPKIGLDAYTAVAALAHVGHIDDEALKLALKSDCFYVGGLGSRRTHAKRVERLAEAGLAAEEIGRIKSPIGLDLGATTPPEIALSVMAEILRALRGAKGKGAA